ncbi:unnamed protein product [Bursaphelenchus xylophilus]|uniref:(pine wood nematode) hypothetical protein n=1 Tax=Bursaphelenchus xylophilus TaxID=6326 RepID=A0A1I7SBQ9_BURXY|nr:unnamed protein product [Bursaphelenchus xylophilus]CAG9111198.1 unnamed protein product [Bursaphelenchus xylophilus]
MDSFVQPSEILLKRTDYHEAEEDIPYFFFYLIGIFTIFCVCICCVVSLFCSLSLNNRQVKQDSIERLKKILDDEDYTLPGKIPEYYKRHKPPNEPIEELPEPAVLSPYCQLESVNQLYEMFNKQIEPPVSAAPSQKTLEKSKTKKSGKDVVVNMFKGK